MQLIGRRNFLAQMGLGGGSFLLGNIFRHNLLPEAQGAEAVKKRFFLITNANGFLEQNFAFAARSETDFDLTPVYKPLAPFKSSLVVAQKFFNTVDPDLHGNQFASLSVMPSPAVDSKLWSGPPGGISIDRFLAKRIGGTDAFASTAQGIVGGGTLGVARCVSCDGPNEAFPAIASPIKAYEKYFGAGMVVGGAAPDLSRVLAQDKSLLDLISADITRMRGRLSGPEAAKMDQYETSIRGIERQLTQLAANGGSACQVPARPGDDTKTGVLNPNVVAAHIDIAVAAQACGLTRVSHVSILGFGAEHVRYSWLNDSSGHHNEHHAAMKFRQDSDVVAQAGLEAVNRIDSYILGTVARAATNFSLYKETGGTMLDNSLVAYINVGGGRHHYGHYTYSATTVGELGGALRTGRFLQYPEKKHCISDLFVSWAHGFGIPINTFGQAQFCKGAVPGYLG